jgi:hypothetical protein
MAKNVPKGPDEMLVTKRMLDLGLASLDSKFGALESKMDAGFSRVDGKIHQLEGLVHTVAAEMSRTLLLMEQQRSENRIFFEAFGLTKDRHVILESRVERIEKKLGI